MLRATKAIQRNRRWRLVLWCFEYGGGNFLKHTPFQSPVKKSCKKLERSGARCPTYGCSSMGASSPPCASQFRNAGPFNALPHGMPEQSLKSISKCAPYILKSAEMTMMIARRFAVRVLGPTKIFIVEILKSYMRRWHWFLTSDEITEQCRPNLWCKHCIDQKPNFCRPNDWNLQNANQDFECKHWNKWLSYTWHLTPQQNVKAKAFGRKCNDKQQEIDYLPKIIRKPLRRLCKTQNSECILWAQSFP